MTMMTRLLGRLWGLPRAENTVRVERDVAVPARDGAALLTDIYHPIGKNQPPCVLLRSPYGRGSIVGIFARLFAERGYTTVVQSTRGTFGSGGSFNPFFQERDDGLDAVDWIERQRWYGGRLGLWGVSYMGQAHWAMAAELGDRIAAMAIVRSTSDFAGAIWEGDGFRMEDFLTWISMLAEQERTNAVVQGFKRQLFGDPLSKLYTSLPLVTIDERAFGRPIDYWREWMAHEDPADPFWQSIRDRGTLSRVTAPVSMLAGWSDLFIAHQLRDYEALRAADRTVRLKVDPWTHTSLKNQSGSIKDGLEWFDIHLKGRPPKSRELDRVTLWVNGANEWRDEVTWPPAHVGSLSLRLVADGGLVDGDIPNGERAFIYDPEHPTPSLAGPKLTDATGRGDMRPLAARDDVLCFTGASLDHAIEIAGEAQIVLTTSADGTDHDLFVCLCDVDDTGKSTNIADGYRRLSSNSPGEQRTVTIILQPAYWRVAVGHRLQLLIAAGAFPRYARNLGFGEGSASAVRTRRTSVTVHCGVELSSCFLPVVE